MEQLAHPAHLGAVDSSEAERTPLASSIDAADSNWFRFVSRWALLPALTFVALLAVFFPVIAAAGSVPMEYAELVAASHRPALYRLAAVLDILVWLGIGGTLVAFAAVFARRAPIRATFLAVCGAGQVVGALGGFLRLTATTELAARYAAAALDAQAALAQAYLTLGQTIGAHYSLGSALYGAGFLLIASVAFPLAGFPRWLAVWFALSGSWSLVAGGVSAAGSPALMAVFPLYAIAGIIALHVAIAAVFWRRAPALVAAPPGSAAA